MKKIVPGTENKGYNSILYYCLFLGIYLLSASYGGAQQNILEIASPNPSPSNIHLKDFPSGQWPKNVCGNDTWMTGASPKEWKTILDDVNSDDNNAIVGVSGKVYNPHTSKVDVWFTHPFGFDYNFEVQWKSDPNLDFLESPSVKADEDEHDARTTALARGFQGDIHVEVDSLFVPPFFRAKDGDNVAVFGRWVVDCGHDNFQSEIHPPLLFVKARALAKFRSSSYTEATVISRPFMVAQTFEKGKTLRDYMFFQTGILTAIEAVPFGFLYVLAFQYEAKPNILNKSFTGSHSMSFNIRPPQPALPNEHLFVSYHFTTRTGVSVQLRDVIDGQGTINVTILFDESKYIYPQLPNPIEETIPIDIIKKWNDQLHYVLVAGEFGAATNPFALGALQKGVKTTRYNIPVYPEQNDLTVSMNELRANGSSGVTLAGITEDNNQVYPIRGSIKVEWVFVKPEIVNNPCAVNPIQFTTNLNRVDFMPDNFNKSQLITISNPTNNSIQLGKISVDGPNGNRFLLQNKTIFSLRAGMQQPPEDISGTIIPAHGSASFRVAISNPIRENLIATIHIASQGCELKIPVREFNSFVQ